MRRDVCTCPTEHTVSKLGHTATCPFQGTVVVRYPTPVNTAFVGCPRPHLDGTPHDFSWATLDNGVLSTGVCSCGLSAIVHDMMAGEE